MLNGMPERHDFINRIHQLFQQWRKGRFNTALVNWCLTAPLLQSVLVSLSLNSTTMPTAVELVKLYLAWTVELLRPAADTPPTSKAVRDFTILATYYGQGEAAKTVYQALGGTESTFRTNWSPAATAAAAELLYQHWQMTVDPTIGQQWQLYALRHAVPPAQHAFLQLLAVSTTPWSIDWLAQLPCHLAADSAALLPTTPLDVALTKSRATLQQLPVDATIAWLGRVGWLSPVDKTSTPLVALPSALRAQLCDTLTPDERHQGHRLAAHCAFLAQDSFHAAWHWLQAGEEQAAVQLLLAKGQGLLTLDEFDDDSSRAEGTLSPNALETLAQLLDQVSSPALDAPDWGRLKRLRGRVAQLQARQSQGAAATERAQWLQRTLAEYQAALHFLPPGVERAAVHYQLAELSFALDSLLADQHLRHCIEQLTAQPTIHPLLVRAYIKRAWLTIQQRPDLTAAEANLKHARLLLDDLGDGSPTVWSDWYNAWGTLCFCKGEFSKGVDALAQGIDLLRAQPDQVRLCMMLHNQGLEFSTQPSGDQQIALHYLQQSLAIAVRLNHVQMQMLGYKAIGGCYFYLQQYAEAIRYYEQAYTLIATDSDFKVHLCYDLAEAHVMQAHCLQAQGMQLAPAAAITYFRQGFTLAQQMALQELIGAYHDLAAQSPWLWIEPYKPRMAAAIHLLLNQGQLKSHEYAQTARINEKTALKDLQSWVAQKILQQSGKARATTYTLSKQMLGA